jgi:hypothetical protein
LFSQFDSYSLTKNPTLTLIADFLLTKFIFFEVELWFNSSHILNKFRLVIRELEEIPINHIGGKKNNFILKIEQ